MEALLLSEPNRRDLAPLGDERAGVHALRAACVSCGVRLAGLARSARLIGDCCPVLVGSV